MFCPSCGQQQPADSTKYCPRCGTLIAGLAEWLAAGGTTFIPRETPAPAVPSPQPSPRRKGMRRGAKVMFLGGFLLPFLIALSVAVDDGAPLVLSFALFFIGLSMMLYARIFSDDAPRSAGIQMRHQLSDAAATALPPAANRADDFTRRGVRTAELSQPPPSVTDHTTRLLDNE